MLAIGYVIANVRWEFIFLITQLFGVRMYTIRDKEDCKRIQKRIGKNSSHLADGNKGYGYAVGFWYLMSISIENSDNGDRYSIWLIATDASYANLMKDKESVTAVDGAKLDDESAPVEKTALKVYDRAGSFYNNYFKKREIAINSMKPRPEQEAIIESIRKLHVKQEHSVVFLHGPPGSGKSLVGILLANSYKGSYCNTLKPWQPGDTIANLYADVEPTAEAPLILAFDEFDGALIKIHSGIEPHKNLPIQVADKAGWNQMLDEIQRGMYPHLILLLTSNRGPEFINALDTSYIRKGRVDLIMELS